MTGFVRKLTGAKDQKQAARDAANAQKESSQQAIDYTKETVGPYSNLGASALPQYQTLLSDVSGSQYLRNNPMFEEALKYSSDQLMKRSAAAGRFNSGDTREALFRNYLATGNDIVNQAHNRLLQPIQLGANAATGQAGQISGLLTDQGTAAGAGAIGAANATAAGNQSALNLAATIGGFALSDRRVKKNMHRIGRDPEGNNVYRFEYKGKKNAPKYIGYSAQEIAKRDPQNVMLGRDGVLRVSGKYAPVRVS